MDAKCQAMMAEHEKMMADMNAADLDELSPPAWREDLIPSYLNVYGIVLTTWFSAVVSRPRKAARRTNTSRVSRICERRARLRTFHLGHRATQKPCAGHAWMPSGSSRRRDASAPSCGRHPVDAREHARHVALIAESGSVRCLCK
jgi:hypothetical protein